MLWKHVLIDIMLIFVGKVCFVLCRSYIRSSYQNWWLLYATQIQTLYVVLYQIMKNVLAKLMPHLYLISWDAMVYWKVSESADRASLIAFLSRYFYFLLLSCYNWLVNTENLLYYKRNSSVASFFILFCALLRILIRIV